MVPELDLEKQPARMSAGDRQRPDGDHGARDGTHISDVGGVWLALLRGLDFALVKSVKVLPLLQERAAREEVI